MKPLPSWLTSVSELFGLSGDEAECYVCVWYLPPKACVLKTYSPAGGSILWEAIISWGLLFHRCINPLMDSYNGIIGSWWYPKGWPEADSRQAMPCPQHLSVSPSASWLTWDKQLCCTIPFYQIAGPETAAKWPWSEIFDTASQNKPFVLLTIYFWYLSQPGKAS